jgi:acetate kinase
MNILVLNAGSSSLKYQVIEMPNQTIKCIGLVERIGSEKATFSYENKNKKYSETLAILNHEIGLQKVTSTLLDSKIGVIKSVQEIAAVGHRVVHGGNKFSETIIVNQEVKENIRDLFDLAPLHNPANLMGIEIAETIFTTAKQIVVFDTAFHQTMPKEAYKYAIKNSFLETHQIRAYGFHGTSHKYVSEKAIAYLGTKSRNIISIHLGNGCSISAIKNGKSIENSMGFAPMNGLIMGTRSGDLDPSVIFYLMNTLNKTADEVNNLLQKNSGMQGLTGYSDLREISEKAEKGDSSCQEALALAGYRIRKFIGAYTAILNGLDAIIFTAGIGENSSIMRALACQNLEFLGIELDLEKNNRHSKEIREIQSDKYSVKLLIIPTNEEIEIAKQSYELLK